MLFEFLPKTKACSLVPPSTAVPDAALAKPGPSADGAVARRPLDLLQRAWQARLTNSGSPVALTLAFCDWALHMANAPGHQQAVMEKAARRWLELCRYTLECCQGVEAEPCIRPFPGDRRFNHEGWGQFPYNVFAQTFLNWQMFWRDAVTGVSGVSPSHERMVEFVVRQILDIYAPSNYPLTNPMVTETTLKEGGTNLVKGLHNFLEDWTRVIFDRPPIGAENFIPGKQTAATPGRVIYRNELIELIQYSPTTETVRPEPVLIVPAWIMKYYILDLSPENSLVKTLVDSGFTVFMISWRNPGAELRDLGMDDYRRLGVMAALNAIAAVCPDEKVHATGYCLGGTLLAIAAAEMARDRNEQLASMTMFAAQVDFREAGELMLFINDSQVAYLEDVMWERGYLDTRQMAQAFQLLRSNDLIWSQGMRQYMLGQRPKLTDLMAWNADATRMPYRMHSEYLRYLFLRNDFAEGRYKVDGRPVVLSDIEVPIFAVGTETDHVAPWRSVYKVLLLTNTDATFLLTAGGHNVGILGLGERRSGRPNRSYRISTRHKGCCYVDSESWLAGAERQEGSWWAAWIAWLAERSGTPKPPPQMGASEMGYPPLNPAPGTYVFER